jgi:hypothetical protein
VVGRVFLSPAAPQDRKWMWIQNRTPVHGYEPTRESARIGRRRRIGANDGEACRLLADKVLKRLQPSGLFGRALIWLGCYSHPR